MFFNVGDAKIARTDYPPDVSAAAEGPEAWGPSPRGPDVQIYVYTSLKISMLFRVFRIVT